MKGGHPQEGFHDVSFSKDTLHQGCELCNLKCFIVQTCAVLYVRGI